MALNTIELPPILIAELYGSALTDPSSPQAVGKELKEPVYENSAPEPETGEIKWKILGNNTRNILVLVREPEHVFLSDTDLAFLTGILSACRLSMEEVALVNLNNHPELAVTTLIRDLKSRIVLSFDLEPASLGLPVNFPHYQLQPFSGTTYLYSPSLKMLEKDKVEKSKLWVCLKRLFNL